MRGSLARGRPLSRHPLVLLPAERGFRAPERGALRAARVPALLLVRLGGLGTTGWGDLKAF